MQSRARSDVSSSIHKGRLSYGSAFLSKFSMASPLQWRDYKNLLPMVQATVKFCIARAVDPQGYSEIVEYLIKNPSFSRCSNTEKRLEDLRFHAANCVAFCTNEIGMVYPSLIEKIIDALAELWIVHRERDDWNPNENQYFLNITMAKQLGNSNKVLDHLFGFPYIAEKYRNSVYKIITTNENGDLGIGSAFLIKTLINKEEISLLATNLHVAENIKGLRVETADGASMELTNIVLPDIENHPDNRDDIAFIVLKDNQAAPGFTLRVDSMVLDEVITIGYPPVPQSIDSYQLIHKGEINAFVESYDRRRYIIFSAKTQPGNSGGPLVDETGYVVGIVSRDLLEQRSFKELGTLPYYGAIPADRLQKFCNSKVLPLLQNSANSG